MTDVSKIVATFQRYPSLFHKFGWVIEELVPASGSRERTETGPTMNLLGTTEKVDQAHQKTSSANLTEPEPYLYVLLSAGIIELSDVLGPMQQEEAISLTQGKIATLFGKTVKRQPIREFLDQGEIEELLARERGPRTVEGVTMERSDPVSEDSKLDKAALSPVFEGELNRAALAEALKVVLDKEGLSERQAASRIGVDKNDINRARNGLASIDKTSQILSELGYPPKFTIPE